MVGEAVQAYAEGSIAETTEIPAHPHLRRGEEALIHTVMARPVGDLTPMLRQVAGDATGMKTEGVVFRDTPHDLLLEDLRVPSLHHPTAAATTG